MSFISEHTLIPIGTAVLLIGGGAGWMTKISIVEDAHGDMIRRSEQKLDSHSELFQEIRERLIRIETVLKKKKNKED